MKRSQKRNRGLWIFLLVLYGISMLWLLLGQRIRPGVMPQFSRPTADRINLRPIATVKLYLNLIKSSKDPYLLVHSWVNLVGNVVMFIPLGYLLPKTFTPLRKFFKLFLCVMLSIIAVELLQLFTGLGSCDIDDLILNMAGAVIGYLIWHFKTK